MGCAHVPVSPKSHLLQSIYPGIWLCLLRAHRHPFQYPLTQMETSKFNDLMHELICRDRYLLDSTQSGMWVRELYRDLPEAEIIKEWWGEHVQPDLEAMLVLTMVERSVRHHHEAGTVLQGREIPSIIAASYMAFEGAMELEGMALGVSELLARQG